MCAKKVSLGKDLAAALGNDMLPTTARGFSQVLAELKKSASPATVGIAETLLQKAGGHSGIGDMLYEDFQKIRGEGLEDWEKATHVTDYKVLKGMYEIIARLMAHRDEMVQGATDPLAELDEQDLMQVAAEAAKMRLQVDREFRLELLAMIAEVDPQAIEERYLSRYGILSVVGDSGE